MSFALSFIESRPNERGGVVETCGRRDLAGLTDQRFTRKTHSRASGRAARRLPRRKKGSAGATCKRRDAGRLALHEPARPAGAVSGVLSGATSS